MSSGYADHYAQFHPDTAAHEAQLRLLHARWLGAHLPADRSAVVLDVGCGRGYAVAWLRDLGFARATGIDPDEGQAAFGRARGWPVECAPDTAGHLRARAGTCDLILLMDVLEHLPPAGRTELLAAVRSCLRPGGRLLCTVPNASSAVGLHWLHQDPTHATTFTVPSLRHALAAAGLEVQSVAGAEFFVRPRFLFWLPTRRAVQWWLLALVRLRQRLVYLAELGFERGAAVPLGPNLVAVARRPE